MTILIIDVCDASDGIFPVPCNVLLYLSNKDFVDGSLRVLSDNLTVGLLH